MNVWKSSSGQLGSDKTDWAPLESPGIVIKTLYSRWLNTVSDKLRAEHKAELRAQEEEREAATRIERQQWYERYEAYLQTDAWRRIGDLVLDRDKGRCRGCGGRKATQVHHLTYERFGSEMLFDLMAICEDCYQRIHRKTYLHCENVYCDWLQDIVVDHHLEWVLNHSLSSGPRSLVCPRCHVALVQWDPHKESPNWDPLELSAMQRSAS